MYKYFRNQRLHGRGSVSACAALKNRGGFNVNYYVSILARNGDQFQHGIRVNSSTE
ncbi:MAG: hypothetical protein LBK25_00140 [Treponema sp.]|nr:hypothetical protein [Treponema sp.]